MREQQRILQQQPDPSVVRRHIHPGRGVGQHALAHPHQADIGANEAGDDMQGRGLARTVGSEHREHLARRDGQLHVQMALCHDRAKLHLGHPRLPRGRPG
jgi:hypothetical protein